MHWTPHTGAEPREGAVLKASGPQAQPACAGVRWAGIGAVAVRRDELDGTGAELTIPMTVPTSCRAYRADARSAGRDICGNQDLHVPVLQRARDMQVFLYIPRLLRLCLQGGLRLPVCRVTTLTFFQLKTNWDNQLASVDSALIDVQNWYASLGHLSLHLCSLSLAG